MDMKKRIICMLLAAVMLLMLIPITAFAAVHDSESEYFTSSYFDWKDLKVSTDNAGKLTEVSAAAWYNYGDASTIAGRDYGFYIVKTSEDKVDQAGNVTNLPLATFDGLMEGSGKRINKGKADSERKWLSFSLTAGECDGMTRDDDYNIWFWTSKGDDTYNTYESKMGTMTAITINRYVKYGGGMSDSTADYVLDSTIESMNIIGQKLSAVWKKYNDGTQDGTLNTTISNQDAITESKTVYNLYFYFDKGHNFVYDAKNGKITATCTDDCPMGWDEKPLTLTLTPPASLVCDGKPKEFTFAEGEAAAWKAAGLELPTIEYYLDKPDTPELDKLDGAPTDAAEGYVVKVKVGEKEAQVNFNITPAPLQNPEKVTGQAPTETVPGWKDYYVRKGINDAANKYYEDAAATVPIENLDAWKAQGGNGYIAPLTHTITPVDGLNPTDKAAGYKPYYECKNCGKYYEDAAGQKEIPDINAWKAEKGNGYLAPLHGTDTNKDHLCDACGAQLSGHKGTLVAGTAPTFLSAGNKSYYKCDCGKYFEDEACKVEIPDLEKWKAEGGNGYLPRIESKPEPQSESESKSPQTGDNSLVTLWVLLLALSSVSLCACLVLGKKRKNEQ